VETNNEEARQLEEIRELIREHQQKQNYSQGFGSPAQLVKSILREYEDKTTKAYSDVKQRVKERRGAVWAGQSSFAVTYRNRRHWTRKDVAVGGSR
jgi:hypothetical protein